MTGDELDEDKKKRFPGQPPVRNSAGEDDPQNVESPEIITKSPRNATQEARWQLYRRLVEQDGIKCEEAAKLCGYAPEYGYQINQKLKARGQTVATIPEKLYRKADRRAAQILDAKPWGSMKEVRDSAVTSVISEIWRRKYPTKIEGAGVQSYSFTKVDLECCRPDNQLPVEPPVGDPVAIPVGKSGPGEETA